MSRIGNRKIEVPAGVTVELDNDIVTVTGPKGSLNRRRPPGRCGSRWCHTSGPEARH